MPGLALCRNPTIDFSYKLTLIPFLSCIPKQQNNIPGKEEGLSSSSMEQTNEKKHISSNKKTIEQVQKQEVYWLYPLDDIYLMLIYFSQQGIP